MKIMVGTANLNQGTADAKIRHTSARLTKVLARKQEEAEPKTEVFDLKRALHSAQAKLSRLNTVTKSNVRRDLLAEAKISAVMREWKDR